MVLLGLRHRGFGRIGLTDHVKACLPQRRHEACAKQRHIVYNNESHHSGSISPKCPSLR